MAIKKKLLILDRDGTIIVEPPEDYQVDSLEKLGFLPGAIRALHTLRTKGDFHWVMITNQDGLGTEAFPEETFWAPHNKMMHILAGEGIEFEEVLIDRTFQADHAPTRKPGTALLTHYLNGAYDLEHSIVVGDRPSDIQLAKNLGAKGILLGRSTDQQDDGYDLRGKLADTLILETESWQAIVDCILGNSTRSARVERNTLETEIQVSVDLDGSGKTDNQTGIGFFDHMLDQLGKHSGMDVSVKVAGDLHIDEHHTIEDAALALGTAIRQALGDKRGIERYGCFQLAMDDSLAQVALDFSGRPWLVFSADFQRERVGGMPTEMVSHFFQSFCDTAGCNLNLKIEGENVHHMIEAAFKGVARAIRLAIQKRVDSDELPTTKGVL
ncbi:MAG: bifunctional histidinol-phosphatase/imidazoleglycerol-phosphate dehydratase HisB [Bacteroidota bacterium]